MPQKAAKINMILHKIKVGLYRRFNLSRSVFDTINCLPDFGTSCVKFFIDDFAAEAFFVFERMIQDINGKTGSIGNFYHRCIINSLGGKYPFRLFKDLVSLKLEPISFLFDLSISELRFK